MLLSKSDGDPVYLSMGWRFLRKTESWERRSLNGTINATWKMIGGRRRRAVDGMIYNHDDDSGGLQEDDYV